jgi:hypothetical protein
VATLDVPSANRAAVEADALEAARQGFLQNMEVEYQAISVELYPAGRLLWASGASICIALRKGDFFPTPLFRWFTKFATVRRAAFVDEGIKIHIIGLGETSWAQAAFVFPILPSFFRMCCR